MLVMFPGQGSQSIGMGREVLELFPYTSVVFEAVEDSTQLLVRRLCAEGPEDQLRLSENQQPCLLAVSVAVWKVLEQEAGISPSFVAGHSLGEYSALVASQVLELTEAASLVRKRGLAMQAAVPVGVGGMSAVMGIDAHELKKACESLASFGVLEIANYNCPNQLIVSGHLKALEQLPSCLENARVIPLNVSAPFHSSLMEKAKSILLDDLKRMNYSSAKFPIFANTTGEVVPVDGYNSTYLAQQVSAPVLWEQTLISAREKGCEIFIECGPGKVLTGLAKRTFPRGTIQQFSTEKNLVDVIKKLSALR